MNVQIKEACLTYEGKPLFTRLQFTLLANAWTCILGASGGGKSSLLRLIAGLDVGASGSAIVTRGHELLTKADIAYMAQTDLLLPWLDCLHNVLIGYALRKQKVTPQIRAQAADLLEGVGLTQAIYKTPDALSGGMRQRVALARTLFEDKPVVLMDEPFAALDAITKWRLQNLVAEKMQGKTVLLITHDPLEALRLGHRLHILSGSPATLDEPLVLDSNTPRDVDDPRFTHQYQALLLRLQQAQ